MRVLWGVQVCSEGSIVSSLYIHAFCGCPHKRGTQPTPSIQRARRARSGHNRVFCCVRARPPLSQYVRKPFYLLSCQRVLQDRRPNGQRVLMRYPRIISLSPILRRWVLRVLLGASATPTCQHLTGSRTRALCFPAHPPNKREDLATVVTSQEQAMRAKRHA